jgi:hypothetical protein
MSRACWWRSEDERERRLVANVAQVVVELAQLGDRQALETSLRRG